MDEAKIILGILEVIGKIALRLIDGDEGPEPMRLSMILPVSLLSDIEHLKQRRLMKEQLRDVT